MSPLDPVHPEAPPEEAVATVVEASEDPPAHGVPGDDGAALPVLEGRFVSVDQSGSITTWTASAERTFYFARAEVKGQPLAKLVAPDSQETVRGELDALLGGGPARQLEIDAVDAQGREFPALLSLVPIDLASGYAFNALLQDLTKQAITPDTLARLRRDHAEVLDSIRTSFDAPARGEDERVVGALVTFEDRGGPRPAAGEDEAEEATGAPAEALEVLDAARLNAKEARLDAKEAKVRADEAAAEAQAAREEAHGLRAQLDATRLELEEKEKELVGATDAARAASAEAEQREAKLVETDAATESVRAELEELRAEAAGATTRVEELSAELTAAKGRIEELTSQAAAGEERGEDLSTELAESNDRVEELTRELAAGQEQVDGLAAELATATERVESLTAEVASGKEREEALAAELTAASERGESLSAEVEAAKERIEELSAELAAANERAEERSAGLGEVHSQLDDARRRADEAQAELDRTQADLGRAQALLEERDRRVEELDGGSAEIRAELERTREELEATRSDLESARAEAREAGGRAEETNEAAESARREADELRTRAQDAERRVEEARAAAEEAGERAEEAERFRLAFDQAPIGMALTATDGRFLRVNRSLCELLGYSEEQLLAPEPPAIVHEEDLEPKRDLAQRMLAGKSSTEQAETRYLHADGRTLHVKETVSLARDADGEPVHFVFQFEDVTERKQLEEAASEALDRDPVTGLFNRRRFEEELSRKIAEAAHHGGGGAAVLLNLQDFDSLKGDLPEETGEELLRTVAASLREHLGNTDLLARLSGDEFAVLLPDADADKAQSVAEQLVQAIGPQVVKVGDKSIRITLSVGVALFDERDHHSGPVPVAAVSDGSDGANLPVPVGGPLPLSPVDGAPVSPERVHRALEEDLFFLYCQPIVDLRTSDVAQYELLLRMSDEDGNLILPRAFLQTAEESGLIRSIDHWVVRRAIRLLAEGTRAGKHLRFEVNLSGSSVDDPDLPGLVEQELITTGADPSNLVLEVPEMVATSRHGEVKDLAKRLRALGCRFAVDNFGSAVRSFRYIKDLPLDFLKLDGDLIATLPESRTDQLVVKAIVDIARGMGCETIAEMVADDETLFLLRQQGVGYAQGYQVGRPQPVSEI